MYGNFEINESNNNLFKNSLIDNYLEMKGSASQVKATHPLHKMQLNKHKVEELENLRRYAVVYGSFLPFELTLERNAIANMRREFPLKSNNHGLNLALGKYDQMDYEDFLGKDKVFDVDENLFVKCDKVFQ